MTLDCFMSRRARSLIFVMIFNLWYAVGANEISDSHEINFPTYLAVVSVRENAKTGESYIVISDPFHPRDDLAKLDSKQYRRPNYRMLQKGVNAKEVG